MKKPVGILVIILVAAVSWIFFKNFQITGLAGLRVVPRTPVEGSPTTPLTERLAPLFPATPETNTTTASTTSIAPPPTTTVHRRQDANTPQGRTTIRIASFNLDSLTATKMRRVDALLADICRMFDVIALQGVQAQEDYIIPRLAELMNKQGGRDFDYLVGPRLGPPGYQQQYAFVYDQQAVMCDRPELYTIDDRDNLMVQEPLVAWFRTVRAPADKAFTFSLVNVSVEPEHAKLELAVLDNVLLNVRDDGRGEDDVILAGHFAAPYDQLGDLNRLSGIGYAIASLPTDVEGRNSIDNIVFDKDATVEFNGKSGVLDFLRELNLSLQEAVDISRHLPVWAEFSIYEGGEKGRMATLSRQTQ